MHLFKRLFTGLRLNGLVVFLIFMIFRSYRMLLPGVLFLAAVGLFFFLYNALTAVDDAAEPMPSEKPPDTTSLTDFSSDIPVVHARDDAGILPDESLPPDGSSSNTAVIRSWSGTFEPSLATVISNFEAGNLSQFSLSTFDGESVTVNIQRTRESQLGARVLVGTVDGEPGSMVTLAHYQHANSGAIIIPSQHKSYEIRPAGDGGIVLSEIDTHALGECHICLQLAQQSKSIPPAPQLLPVTAFFP